MKERFHFVYYEKQMYLTIEILIKYKIKIL